MKTTFDKIDAVAHELEALPSADVLVTELIELWDDLDKALALAVNGQWSMGCENVTARIMRLTRVAGPTPWGDVPITMLINGWYVRIHEAMGITVEYSTADAEYARKLWKESHMTRRNRAHVIPQDHV